MTLENHILQSWHRNAKAWTQAVRQEEIESRALVTNQAIVAAVEACQPQSVLDLGCGEGWLSRALIKPGRQVLGVDAVPSLIQQAQQLGEASYQTSDYDAIARGSLRTHAPFEAVVCNFSLFGKQSVDSIVRFVPHLLSPKGYLVIQTLHPHAVVNESYQDGWREGSWQGFSKEFTDPAPWYFRTLASWVQLLVDAGFSVMDLQEPVHPGTQQPLSIILTGKL